MCSCMQDTKKSRKSFRIVTLSFYCITLSLICQAFCGFSASASANNIANRFYFQDFSADYYLSKDEDGTSRLKVVEKFIAIFPNTDQNHGITRIIPYTNQNGENLTMASDTNLKIQVKHNGISEKPHKIEPGNGYFTVYIGDPNDYVHERQIYELEYEFENVVTSHAECPQGMTCFVGPYQELYWDTNGNDWSQRFDSLTARVHLVGEDVENAFTGASSCYVGLYGTNGAERCQIRDIADGVEFHTEKLSAGENLTFDLEFTAGTFAIPGPTYDYRLLGACLVEIIIALALIGGIFVVYHQTKAKRDYYKGLFLTPEYTPPRDFTVAEMAANYAGQKILGSSKVATLMELAVSHKVELNKVGTEKKPQWTVKILSTNLTLEQADVLKLLAGRDAALETGQEILVKTHTADKALVRLDQKYSKHIEDRLYAAGLHVPKVKVKSNATPKKRNNLYNTLFICGIIWVIISIVALPFLFDDEIPSYITLYGGGGLIATIIILAIAIAVATFWTSTHFQKFYTHTEEGLKWSRYLDGLHLYIKMAEQDRLKFLQSVKGADTSSQGIVKLYEKLLPYAVIFRLETSWLKEMGKYYEMEDVPAPTWYVGGAIFTASDFNSAMRSVSAATIATETAAHSGTSGSSSGFSGGGGGGFSGGGGGGGGGGGW